MKKVIVRPGGSNPSWKFQYGVKLQVDGKIVTQFRFEASYCLKVYTLSLKHPCTHTLSQTPMHTHTHTHHILMHTTHSYTTHATKLCFFQSFKSAASTLKIDSRQKCFNLVILISFWKNKSKTFLSSSKRVKSSTWSVKSCWRQLFSQVIVVGTKNQIRNFLQDRDPIGFDRLERVWLCLIPRICNFCCY